MSRLFREEVPQGEFVKSDLEKLSEWFAQLNDDCHFDGCFISSVLSDLSAGVTAQDIIDDIEENWLNDDD